MKKEKQLEELNIEESKKIHRKDPDLGKLLLWGSFLPTYCKHQYDIVFVGLQPSEYFLKNPHLRDLGNFNISCSDKKFQEQLVKFNFSGSYVTDIIKLQKPAKGRPSEEEIKLFIPFLRKELEIVKPRIVIALGNDAYDILERYKEELSINKLAKIYHPAYRFKKKGEWSNQFKELKKIIKKQKP